MPVDRKVVDDFFGNFAGFDSNEKEEKSFANRISSYIAGQKWVRRPLVISPAICSQYGWRCLSSDLLECETCGAKLCTTEPNIEIYDAYKACIEKIIENLKASHKIHCPWPLTPAPESFLKMLPMPKEESLKHFMKRLKLSLEFKSDFPQIKDGTLSLLALEKQHVTSLCKLAGVSNEEADAFGMSAVALAATGWTLQTQGDDKRTFIACNSCQRSILSRAFNTLNNEKNSESQNNLNTSITENSSSKRLKKEDFDPLEEHRPWCLWIITEEHKKDYLRKANDSDAKTDTETDDIPGWKTFIKSLLRNVSDPLESDLKNNPSKEQIRSVRNLLDTWTDGAE